MYESILVLVKHSTLTLIQTLVLFEKKFLKLKEERDNIVKAKEALELSAAGDSIIF